MAYCTENDLLNQLTQEKRTRSPHAASQVLVGRGFNPAETRGVNVEGFRPQASLDACRQGGWELNSPTAGLTATQLHGA